MSSPIEASADPVPDGLDFRLLGPLEVRRDGTRLDLGPPKQRAVLALLLLNANHVVSTPRLIDELWGEAPPETARAALQVYVAGLRKAFGDRQATLSTKAPGYLLSIDPGAVDLDRFERLRDEARTTSDSGRKAALLRDALDLWRDAPLAEFEGERFAVVAAEQLEERRLGALEERIDADLALGGHSKLISELDTLVVEHPYRERFRAQQMLALYRSGRQADALAAYRSAREAYAEGLGIEPGPELKALERAVLEQDRSLDAPSVDVEPGSVVLRGRTPRQTRIAVAGAVLFAVAAVVAIVAVAGGESQGIVPPPDSVAVIDPETNTIVDLIPVGVRPGPIAAGDGTVWVGSLQERNLTKIDARTRKRSGTVPLDERTPTGLAFDRRRVWVAHGLLGSVSVVDAQFDSVLKVVPVARPGTYWKSASIVAGAGSVWAAFGDATLSRLDPATGGVIDTAPTDGSPAGVAVGYDYVWVASAAQSTVQRFTQGSLDEVGSTGSFGGPGGIAAGAGDVWVTSTSRNVVQRIDIGGESIEEVIPADEGPTAVAVGVDAVWVANTRAGTVSRIDPETNRVVETIDVHQAPAGLVVAGGLVWVTLQEP